ILMLQSLYSDERKELATGLIDLYGTHLRDVAQAQATLFLLLIQSILGALYTVGVLTLLLAEQSRAELGVLSSRGFTRWQITGRFALIGLLNFGLLALPLGILLARLAVGARYEGVAKLQPLSWYLAGAVAFFAWLALVVIIQRASRQNIVEWLQRRARAGQKTSWRQNLLFDGMIFAAGALVFWQLQQTQSILTTNESNALFGQADPLLLLAPTILILALALLWRRLFGPLLAFVASVSRRSEGFSLPVGLTRLARTPGIPAQVILLITVTAALTVFSYVFVASLERRQAELAHYLAGADRRIGLPLAEEAAEPLRREILNSGAVTASADAFRATAALIDQEGLRINGTLLAVDPQTMPAVARFPAGVSQFSVAQITQVLPPVEEVIPVVIANNRALLHLGVGDQFVLQLGNQQATGVVTGIINEFPTLTGAFFLTNLPELQDRINVADVTILNGQNELWLDGVADGPLPGETDGQVSRLADAGELSASFATGLVYQETITALRLNRNLLLFLSSLGFLLAQLFTARQRFAELAIMQALGAERRRLRWLLFGEGLLMLLFGLGMGVASGYLLAWMMRPLLGQTLAGSLAEYGVGPLALGLSSLLLTSAILLASYGLALLLLRFLLNRLQLASSLRLVEE
ncbi:MAG: FtsX-like permease family protein, partial [Anaerolineales bacterium]|nr:FtsX-like permease family protein [Anaerolineales bacterium]